MSIFENNATLKDKVDDTHPLKCTILNTRNTNGYTVNYIWFRYPNESIHYASIVF